MSKGILTLIENADFMFENTPVKIIVNRNCPAIELPGLKVGPFKEGEEQEVRFWIANELEKAGIARLRREEALDAIKLYKMHWKESVQPATQISSLPEDFYPGLRRYLKNLKKDAVRNPEKMKDNKTGPRYHQLPTEENRFPSIRPRTDRSNAQQFDQRGARHL